MTSDISCLISLLGSIWPWLSLWPHFLSSSLHANRTGLLAIPQTCQGSTLSPKDLHICFSPLEHSSRSCHGFCTYFLEVFAQVSPLYRSLSWTPLLSHHHSIQFSLPFFLFFFLACSEDLSPPCIYFFLTAHTRMKASGEQGLACKYFCGSSTENSACHTVSTQ